VDQRMPGKFLIRAVDDVMALGPTADGREIDVEHDADEVTAIAIRDDFANVRIELELVLDVFRRENRSVVELADVLGTVDDLQVPGFLVEEAGIAGFDVTVISHDFGGL